jgi:hypothetical protein
MTLADDDKPYTTVPTSQTDLKARLENDFLTTFGSVGTTDPDEVRAPYATENTDTSAYIGVSPEYMTHADVTTQPFKAEEGPEAELLDTLQGGLAVAAPPDAKASEATAGGGSSAESIYTATSGEDFSSSVVKEEPKADESQGKVQTSPTPAATPSATPSSPSASSTPSTPSSPPASSTPSTAPSTTS